MVVSPHVWPCAHGAGLQAYAAPVRLLRPVMITSPRQGPLLLNGSISFRSRAAALAVLPPLSSAELSAVRCMQAACHVRSSLMSLPADGAAPRVIPCRAGAEWATRSAGAMPSSCKPRGRWVGHKPVAGCRCPTRAVAGPCYTATSKLVVGCCMNLNRDWQAQTGWLNSCLHSAHALRLLLGAGVSERRCCGGRGVPEPGGPSRPEQHSDPGDHLMSCHALVLLPMPGAAPRACAWSVSAAQALRVHSVTP